MQTPQTRQKEIKKNRRKMSRPKIACIIIGLFVCVGAILSMGYDRYERGRAAQSLTELNRQYGPENATDKLESDSVKEEVDARTGLFNSPVDFVALQKKNSDIKAWITQDQSEVDYPVVQTDNNKYYLNHAFDGVESDYGTIMLNSDNHSPFKDDQNTIIFGHNMEDGEMFGNLNRLKSESEKGDIEIYLPSETLHYHIFCVAMVPPDAPVYRISFTEQEMAECMGYLREVATRWEEPGALSGKSRLLTLSTCAEDKRLIVWAYRETKNYNKK